MAVLSKIKVLATTRVECFMKKKIKSVYDQVYSCTAENGKMIGANMSKNQWDQAQIKLKIVFIHENI